MGQSIPAYKPISESCYHPHPFPLQTYLPEIFRRQKIHTAIIPWFCRVSVHMRSLDATVLVCRIGDHRVKGDLLVADRDTGCFTP